MALKTPASTEAVVLLHGIINKPFIMGRLVRELRQNYEVHNWGYPSTQSLIEQHADSLSKFLKGLKNKSKIHFVGFSQGCLIIRYLLSHESVSNAGRFVMIAPPNHGSEIAEDFYRFAWFRGLYGTKSIKQLFARQNAFLDTCGIPRVEFGIIAGGWNDSEGFSREIPGDDDGTISVASAHLEGEKDFIVLRHRHTPLVWASDTVKQTAYFLKNGAFKR